jgi:hypothetical protein
MLALAIVGIETAGLGIDHDNERDAPCEKDRALLIEIGSVVGERISTTISGAIVGTSRSSGDNGLSRSYDI